MAQLTETKKLTREDYQAFKERPENLGRIFEFIDGEIIEKVSGGLPSNIALVLGSFLLEYLRRNPIGYITGADGEYDVPDGNTLIPNVGYISKERQAKLDADAIPFSPDLAIEIQSKTDRKLDMRRKAARYLENGSQMVCLIFLDKTVEVYTADDELVILKIDDALSGGDVLPDLTIPLKEIFPA